MQVHKDIETINEMYKSLSLRADKLYRFVVMYHEYIHSQHDYGSGQSFSMLEIHILTNIGDLPGITATELASRWRKTKGAISQTISHLVSLGYVERKKKEGNSKTIYLYATEEGLRISNMHKSYDVADIIETLQDLQQTCSKEEIDAFYKVIDSYCALLSDENAP